MARPRRPGRSCLRRALGGPPPGRDLDRGGPDRDPPRRRRRGRRRRLNRAPGRSPGGTARTRSSATSWSRGGTARRCRCSDHPGFWDYNSLRLEIADPGADARTSSPPRRTAAQGDLRHRRIEVEHEEAGERLRPGFEALGWTTARLVWMALSEPPAGSRLRGGPGGSRRGRCGSTGRVRRASSCPSATFTRQADGRGGRRAPARRPRAGARDGTASRPPTRSSHSDGDTAEVEQAYVEAGPARPRRPAARSSRRRPGRAARRETFIVADDEGDPKRLYERLGFRPVWIQYEFTRRPTGIERDPPAAGEVGGGAQVAGEGGVGDRAGVPRVRLLGSHRHREVGGPARALVVEVGELGRM